MATTSKAIVIFRSDFGEADRYVQFLTQKWGMITVLAKSARKSQRRYVGGLDLFCHDEISVRGDLKGTPYLTELTVLNSFPGLRDNLERVLMAGKLTQWVKKLADTNSPMPEIYSLVGQTLALLEKESDPQRLELLGLIFKMKLLLHLGLKPSLEDCTKCRGLIDRQSYFDIESGGLICSPCSSGTLPQEHLFLGDTERWFLGNADGLRLTLWDQFQFCPNRTQRLSRLMTQFAQFHTHLRLPV